MRFNFNTDLEFKVINRLKLYGTISCVNVYNTKYCIHKWVKF